MKKKQKISFPKGFFTQPRPHATKNDSKDTPPFKWSNSVLKGKSKVKIVAMNKKTTE